MLRTSIALLFAQHLPSYRRVLAARRVAISAFLTTGRCNTIRDGEMPARQCLLGHIATRAGQDQRHVIGQPVAGVLEQEPASPNASSRRTARTAAHRPTAMDSAIALQRHQDSQPSTFGIKNDFP